MNHWDRYFLSICDTVASNCKCRSRQIGAILVRDKSIISTGYNGPPRNTTHCGDTCPRHQAGYGSGEHLELCPAVHAEANAVIDAARKGASVLNCTLYMNSIIPCKSCMGILINAGVIQIVITDSIEYDSLALRLAIDANIYIREFDL
jgi:dCMP deaminase